MKITAFHEHFALAKPFTISRGTRTHVDIVRVVLDDGGLIVEGECTPYPRYGETPESVLDQILSLNHVRGLNRSSLQHKLPAGAARNAVDSAFWRLEAAREQHIFPYHEFTMPTELKTAVTVPITSTEEMAALALQYQQQGAGLLKIKLDDQHIVERVKAIREAVPDAELILDANEGWEKLDLAKLFAELAQFNIRMIEQPLPADKDEALSLLDHPIPLCADESCHTRQDLTNLAGRYEMINIKLDKTGGLTEALALYKAAKKQQFDVMVGCMIGTSLAMETALPVAKEASIVDLDGPLLLSEDRDHGLNYQQGKINLS